MLEVTEWARDILSRSVAAGRRLNPSAVVRVVASGDGIVASFAEAPEPTDHPVEGADGAFVAEAVQGQLDVTEPHAQLVLKPAGSAPNERAHD